MGAGGQFGGLGPLRFWGQCIDSRPSPLLLRPHMGVGMSADAASDTVSITHDDFIELVDILGAKISKLDLADPVMYGVPRGGLVPAVYLSHRLGIPLARSPDGPGDVLVVDDILDTGATYDRLSGAAAHYVVLLAREARPKVVFGRMHHGPWVRFPWEVGGRPAHSLRPEH